MKKARPLLQKYGIMVYKDIPFQINSNFRQAFSKRGKERIMKFYICKHCGNIIAYVKESGVPVMCCGEKMQELVPNTTDAAVEKHVPVVQVDGQTVTVTIGSVEHPMVPEHHIEWIALHTSQGNQRKELKPGDNPQAKFMICDDDEVLAAYAYCNLHVLWKK